MRDKQLEIKWNLDQKFDF